MTTKSPKISIITVVFNGEKIIGETINSLINQDFKNFEYIIIDGASKDKTVDIIKKYAASHNILWISEPDKGIYDAMNKGIKKASGDYIYFLNAGDKLHDNHVLQKVSDLTLNNPSIIIGRVSIAGLKNIYHPINCETSITENARDLFHSHLCHQALFVQRKHLIETGSFPMKYPRFADFYSAWKIIKTGPVVNDQNLIVAEFSLDGISSDWRIAEKLYAEKEDLLKDLGFGRSKIHYQLGYLRTLIYKMKRKLI